ncbi:MAG: hypothetical protein E5V63_04170 [Mesorhizobium sp.]|nr:MAG: hypothetical protein E5V63_04170 [Mesorhizobium sp.]
MSKNEYPQFAYTGLTPATGYVGYVNIQETEHGVRFIVRSEGENPTTAVYEIPKWEGVRILGEALKSITEPKDIGRLVPEHGSGP